MKRLLVTLGAALLVTAPAWAQVDPGFATLMPAPPGHPDNATGGVGHPINVLKHGAVFTVGSGPERVEHWVTAKVPADGLQMAGLALVGGDAQFDSAEQFLGEMIKYGNEAGLTLYYAPQHLLYQPLPVAARQTWPHSNRRVVSCARLRVDTTEVGLQLRLRHDATFEDHWVFYPDYIAPNHREGAPVYIDALTDCPSLSNWLAGALAHAERTSSSAQYTHAFSVYQFEQLQTAAEPH